LPFFSFINVSAQSRDNIIKSIRQEFQTINKDTSYTTVVLENEEFLDQMPDGGGMLTGYYKNGEIRKIVKWIGISYGVEIMEYYFKEGQLIFVFEQFKSFVYDEKNNELDLTKTEVSFEGRYYFNKKKLIDYVTTGHNRFEDDAIDPEKTLLEEANADKEMLYKHREK
jgi:hypothetical protein